MLPKDTYYIATPLEDPQPFQGLRAATKLASIAGGHPPGHPGHNDTSFCHNCIKQPPAPAA